MRKKEKKKHGATVSTKPNRPAVQQVNTIPLHIRYDNNLGATMGTEPKRTFFFFYQNQREAKNTIISQSKSMHENNRLKMGAFRSLRE
jgi:hypothetical protein